MTTKKIDQDEMVVVARYSDPAEAQLAKSVLEGAGVDSFLSGEEANSLIPAALGARLQVRRGDEATAKTLLNDVPKGASLADDGNDL
jgi:hypothetical protein